MNERPNRWRVALLLALAIPAACGAPAPPPLQGAAIGGPFALIDQDGRVRRDTDFAGRYRLMYFGYTFCPDVCPVDVQHIAQGLRAFERQDSARAARVQPIFVTVDPARDTPAVLKQYVAAFHPRLIGLTGTPAEIAEVAKRYAVAFQLMNQRDRENYLVDHSRTAILFGPDGAPVAIVPQDEGAAAIAATLDRWVA